MEQMYFSFNPLIAESNNFAFSSRTMAVTLHIVRNAYIAESGFRDFPSKLNFAILFLFSSSSILRHTLVTLIVNRGHVAGRISKAVSVQPVRSFFPPGSI